MSAPAGQRSAHVLFSDLDLGARFRFAIFDRVSPVCEKTGWREATAVADPRRSSFSVRANQVVMPERASQDGVDGSAP